MSKKIVYEIIFKLSREFLLAGLKGVIMKNFWSIFIIAVLVIVAFFFGGSFISAEIHDRSLVEEWQSWLPAQEESVEDEESVDENVEDLSEIVIEVEQ